MFRREQKIISHMKKRWESKCANTICPSPQTPKNMVLILLGHNEALLRFKWIASFSGFTWPKTILTPETEHGLTSEFGMGSGGSHALWPATQLL